MTRFTADLWRWEARRDDWWFVSLPEGFGDEVADRPRESRGFRSVPVRVTVGGTTWKTSIFPDPGRGSYSLPIKRSVRDKESIEDGARIEVEVHLID